MYVNSKIIAEPVIGGPFIGQKIPYQSFASVYDVLLGDIMFPLLRRNFEWLVRQYGVEFHSVADVACGTGSFVNYLAQWKVRVFGIDRSPAMLRIARLKNQSNGAIFLQQDMRQLKLPHPVDLITCNFDSLNYLLTIPDLLKAFNRFNANLDIGGNLIFDMITATRRKKVPANYFQRITAPGMVSEWFISWDPQNLVRTVFMQNFINNFDDTFGYDHEIHRERSWPIAIICNLLRNCRFKIQGVHDAHSMLPASNLTTRTAFMVQKAGDAKCM